MDKGTAIEKMTIKQKQMQYTINATPNMASPIFPPCRCTEYAVECEGACECEHVVCEGACECEHVVCEAHVSVSMWGVRVHV